MRMRMLDERNAIVEFGRKLITNSLTTGTGGNLSVYNRTEGLIAIKPSAVDYFKIRPEDVPLVSPQGELVEGQLQPSIEIRFHLDLLNYREDINAVVHTHQVNATTIACMNWELPAVHYLVGFSGNKVPLAEYAPIGTQELSDNILDAIGNYNACLLANHGLVTVGKDLESAFNVAEELELVAKLYIQCKSMGEPKILTDEEMIVIGEKFKAYGQPQKNLMDA
jgi:L-fuculose-phosphate aldolase